MSLGEVELAKVVGSLLDNALLHGQSPLKVRVNRAGLIDQTGRAVARLEVEDSGPGMDPQLLAAATRRLIRAAESRSRPGFSLGLVPRACPVGLLSPSGDHGWMGRSW